MINYLIKNLVTRGHNRWSIQGTRAHHESTTFPTLNVFGFFGSHNLLRSNVLPEWQVLWRLFDGRCLFWSNKSFLMGLKGSSWVITINFHRLVPSSETEKLSLPVLILNLLNIFCLPRAVLIASWTVAGFSRIIFNRIFVFQRNVVVLYKDFIYLIYFIYSSIDWS